ncbi:MAG: PAS domain-containing protein, partial [Polyangiaceae bacterium]
MSNLAAVLREVNERLLITSVREHEVLEASQREKAQLSALLETLNEGVIIADASGRIVMANAAARGMLHIGSASGTQLA